MEDPGYYMPVSFASVSGKIMKHMLLKSISKHMKDKKGIRNSQYRFPKGKCCLTNLMACCRKIIGDVDRVVILTNIGFNEAFDIVSHSVLICKLRR